MKFEQLEIFTSGNSHTPVIFPFFNRSIQIAKPTVAHWGLRKSRLVPEEPSHQVTQAWEQYTAMHSDRLLHKHSQAARPFSNKHVIQNFFKPPLPPPNRASELYRTIVEGGQRAAAVFFCGLGMADRGAYSDRTVKRNMKLFRLLPGFVIKRYATLHLKCVGLVSLFFPKRVCFSRPGSLFFSCVLGY